MFFVLYNEISWRSDSTRIRAHGIFIQQELPLKQPGTMQSSGRLFKANPKNENESKIHLGAHETDKITAPSLIRQTDRPIFITRHLDANTSVTPK